MSIKTAGIGSPFSAWAERILLDSTRDEVARRLRTAPNNFYRWINSSASPAFNDLLEMVPRMRDVELFDLANLLVGSRGNVVIADPVDGDVPLDLRGNVQSIRDRCMAMALAALRAVQDADRMRISEAAVDHTASDEVLRHCFAISKDQQAVTRTISALLEKRR